MKAKRYSTLAACIRRSIWNDIARPLAAYRCRADPKPDAVTIPVTAAGGIADRRGVAAGLALGAAAVQVGAAHPFTSEAKISEVYHKALYAPNRPAFPAAGALGAWHSAAEAAGRDDSESMRRLRAEVLPGDLTDLTSMHRAIEDCARTYFGMSVSTPPRPPATTRVLV
jgi:hypothetical protein